MSLPLVLVISPPPANRGADSQGDERGADERGVSTYILTLELSSAPRSPPCESAPLFPFSFLALYFLSPLLGGPTGLAPLQLM
jgi:hypothetical protein